MGDIAHIIIVDDDPEIRTLVQDYLTEEGYRVSTADGGAEMRRILAQDPADLVILDVRMPEEDGFTIAASLRKTSDVGIIMLTHKGAVVDRVVGLELGADDYVSKPFDLRELLARVRSVLRRAKNGAQDKSAAEPHRLEFAGWTLDLAARRLVSPGGADVELTTAEFNLLSALANHSNRALTRDQLLDMTHGRDWSPFDRSLDNLVSRLRRKLEEDPKRPALIKTVRGVGYIFTPQTTRGSLPD